MFLIQMLNGLLVTEPESSSTFAISGVEELWSSTPSSSPPMQLLMSKMVSPMLRVVKFEVVNAASSLATRRSLLPPLSHKKQRHWYKLLDDEDLVSARRISEFADFVGRNPE